MNARIVLAGGSGFLGRVLIPALVRNGWEVVVLTRAAQSRSEAEAAKDARYVEWDGQNGGDWEKEVDGAKAVINLAGRSVNCRYTRENRMEILNSRVQPVRAIARAMDIAKAPPGVWIQAASSAIYGDRGDELCSEASAPGTGFSPEVCKAWERAYWQAVVPGVRKVLLRIGFVLGKDGGALMTLGGLARWGLGGTVGSGRQYMSWLHAADWIGIVRRALEKEEMDGIYNCVSPQPMRNRDFMRELRHAVHRPWSPAVPAWAVRLGCVAMGTEAELALRGRNVIAGRLREAGYVFQFAQLRDALEDIYGQREPGRLAAAGG